MQLSNEIALCGVFDRSALRVIKAESRTVLVVRCRDFLAASYGEGLALDSDPQLLRLSLEPQLFLWLSS